MRQKIVQKGQILGECRLSKGWTQKTLSEKAGVSRATVCTIERGAAANMQTAESIARALQKPINELFEITIS